MAKKQTARAKTAPKTEAALPDIEIVDQPVSEDHGLVLPVADQLRAFMGGMVSFFRKATELERAAADRLARAKLLKPPTTADEDVKVQALIRESKMGRKATDDHWTITSVLSKLHKSTVAGRERAGKLDDDAAAIAQRLHNDYVEAERRRAREEEERINREKEEQARRDREAELARLEAEAVAREEASPELSERERQYVDFLVLDIYRGSSQGNPQRAAERAGFKDALKAAARLTSSPKVQAAVRAKEEAENIRRQAAAKREMPIEVERTTVKPNVSRAAGVSADRTTWSGEVIDERLFIEAVVGGRHGIPVDVLTVNQAKLTEYARSMHELLDRWPGVRAKKNTTTV